MLNFDLTGGRKKGSNDGHGKNIWNIAHFANPPRGSSGLYGVICYSMTRDARVPPSQQAAAEALKLSEEILQNLELNEVPLVNIALKTSRLARLLNDFEAQKTMNLEGSGYPVDTKGQMTQENWDLAVAAGRKYRDKEGSEKVFVESIEALQVQIRADEVALSAATSAASAVRTTSPRPSFALDDKYIEGYKAQAARNSLHINTERLASRRSMIYQYVVTRHYELKFSGIASDVFGRVRERLDAKIGTILPDAVQRFTAAYDNLTSENPEDWSNAAHGCRRILQDLADAIFPPTDEERQVEVNGTSRTIKLGKDHYINRIMAFLHDKSASNRFEAIVGSHLSYIGDRLDAIFRAAQKGSHGTILTRDEADRYVVYTYLIVGDVLSLL